MSSRLVTSLKKTAGRNSSGRITSFHRGGGAKRLFRKIDLKRTDSSLGFVERIEYDPNRSSRIALVRWQEGVHQKTRRPNEVFPRSRHLLESTVNAATVGPFYLSTLCPNLVGKGSGGDVTRGSPTDACVMVGMLDGVASGPKSAAFHSVGSRERKKTDVKDVFLSALSKGNAASAFSFGSSPIIPRIAVAGAKPAYFVAKERGDAEGKETFVLGEMGKWRADSALWKHRIKRHAAISWHNFFNDGNVNLGLRGGSENDDSIPKAGKDGKKGNGKADSCPVSYIIASHNLKPGDMVMNYNGPKSSANLA